MVLRIGDIKGHYAIETGLHEWVVIYGDHLAWPLVVGALLYMSG
jgi:hypothetical protein